MIAEKTFSIDCNRITTRKQTKTVVKIKAFQ